MSLNITLLNDLRKLQEDRDSGVLVLSRLDQRVTVFHREGMIQGASSNLDSYRIGTYMVRDGYLTDADIPKVIAEARKKKVLFGEAATSKKYLFPAELAEVVRHQAIDLLKHAFKNAFVKESFTKEIRSLYISANINVAYILLELSRSNSAPVEATPASVFTLKNSEDLSGVPWIPKELCLLGELSAASTIPSLTASTGIDEVGVRRILGVFDRLGLLDRVEEGKTAEVPASGQTALVKVNGFPFERLVPKVSNAVFGEKVEVLNNPSSFISEQFKTLKVRIREDFENPPKVLTISSPDQQDGKSLVSANLALTLAMEPGRRTVIVDCDLRNPTLDRYLGVSTSPGLMQHLSNGHLSPYCYMRRVGNLFFMTSGGVSENPIDLLSLRKMQELVVRLKADFDTVIFDAPPYSPIADARIVSGFSDGIIMVIRRGKTSNRSIENAFKLLDQSKLLGVVFNDVKPMLFNTYFNRSYYNYGRDSRYTYPGERQIRTSPKNYLES
jgi:capsular exopolysaccharide synthesis family protein